MTDDTDNRSLECTTCGAVWVTASSSTGADGFDGSGSSDGCLRCGGTLQAIKATQVTEQEIAPGA